ncbi:carboxypeptidase M32 [Sulfitobacter pseudonitzschiae]|uniref:Metal-dependent carboxypeptidase n=1 Tax=Pseudosulfitobacter pseudonitzschiae TaxID=1402135 RepID=A0A9Q2P2R4_9RHOB|nr:carboxypeptidase M32 [Pseudosulfitobacter pseudonitzschiae]MBM2292708.1 carboxypeptidase M32 [Pseudosulfitobacter pseudonitzschiae]MBM2298196.1 carboxypeptidase M32 [Pseudosulfitobacter pseudonitzschiae]MBM2303110.1 carboxypeptidase M32 [Pseudosulfitobacter pseudonitzschiae]MBM2312893.1 carboxypeptidase M32 [Pseudosulfitobacter pseudonitzschiae]MBM2317806.1 carboxypeptidase M32 [Pseudosulfitobacter pseudonitzschiae]
MTPYDALMAYDRDTQALAQVAGRLGWDQETMMPRGAADQRGEEMAAMEAVLHARRTAPQVGDWLDGIDDSTLDAVGQAQMRHIRRTHARATKVPAALASKLARLTSVAQGKWAEARSADDFASFAPVLEEVVALKREEGAALAAGGDLYDAMLQDYEPGTTGAELEAMFSAMRPVLADLRAAVLEAEKPASLTGTFDEAAQMKLSRHLARTFGYDMQRGRVDKAVHPFSSGSGNDVRITTRTNPVDPFNCFYSTIHEVGHAAYEQNIDQAYLLTPLGSGVSMGVHESQSRIYENQIGRSRAFTGWLFGQMKETFGDFGIADEDAFYACVNSVNNGYIRTEADELQYNLHVMLRFDLERALMSGDLAIADLEAAWNDRFKADFGYAVDKASNGVLQDVHWSVGLFGYFPTYSLGNVYAGCLHQTLRTAVPDLDDHLAQGNTEPATSWLRDNVQVNGGLYEPRVTITMASGMEPSEAPLLDYLRDKFSAIYNL